LLVIAWGPIPATRMPLPVVLMIVLAVAGMAALRRQVAAEFPEVQPGSARVALQARASRALHAVQVARRAPEPALQPVEQLERLASLHDHGALSDEEFAAQKTVVLGNGTVAR
ncbi:MAG TPA: SHOCT domain-containing protein, partial [Baekduia sp.]|nr:SHOCT domain-containing protein [Baekduia sp.]